MGINFALTQILAKQDIEYERLFWDQRKYRSIVTRQEYYKHCKDFEDAICSSSQYKDSINGTYILIIKGCPNIPKKSASDWQDLVRQVISFVDETRALKSTNDKCLLKDKKGYLNIRKISDQYAMIGAIGPIQVKWENEIQDTLEKLIGTSVKDKWKKLENKGIPNICSRIILVFYDAYGFCDIEDVQKVIINVPDHNWFHSIFWVSSFTDRQNELSPANPGRVGKFIFSKEFSLLIK